MKKKLLAVFVLILGVCMMLTSCGGTGNEEGNENGNDETPAPLSQQLVNEAADMLYIFNKPGANNVVAASFTLPSTIVDYEGYDMAVNWTLEGGDGLVSIESGDDENTITVKVNPFADADTSFTLKGIVSCGEFRSGELSFTYVIKQFLISNWEYWADNTSGVTMNVRGVVVAAYPYAADFKNTSVFLQDLDGEHGYFAYRLKCASQEEYDTELAVGNVIVVNGTTSIYNGFREMGSGCTYTVVYNDDGSIQTADVTKISLDDLIGDSNINSALDPRQGMIGTISGAKIKSIDWNSNSADTFEEKGAGSVYVTLTKNNADFKIYLSTSNTMTVEMLKAEYEKIGIGYTVDVEGPIAWYNGPQIYPCAGGIKVTSTDVSDEDKVKGELLALTLPAYVSEDTVIDLPTAGSTYKDVSFAWTVSGTDKASIDAGKLSLTIGSLADSAKVTVTATCGSASESKEYSISLIPGDLSEEDVVNALYALGVGESLPGTYTLKGKIISVDTVYSSQYKNVTVTIVVGDMTDKPVQCYRITGTGADTIKVGDTITVSGELTNYNGKFEFTTGSTLDKVVPGEGGGSSDTGNLNTPDEIVNALYALGSGETLAGGPYTLTGAVNKINHTWSEANANMTVTMTVSGRDVQCYYLTNGTSSDCSKIKVGDTITVKGELKNYNGTREFDRNCTLEAYKEGSGDSTTTMTPEEILTALYALKSGEDLTGPYTLSGTITKINTPFDAFYNNVTVTIEVSGFAQYPVVCFRLAGTGSDTIKVGDKITVTGSFTNYNGTFEYKQGCTLDSIDFVAEDTSVTYTTPEQILKALYALDKGASLDKRYSLTGVITAITNPYSTQYSNITVVIVVEGFDQYPVTCYRLMGTGADTLKIGDTITVEGILTHYFSSSAQTSTYEFTSGCTIVTD